MFSAGFAASYREQVFLHILRESERGATDDEIQKALGMKHQTETPRRSELEELGLIFAAPGQFRPTRSGSLAIVWVVTGKKYDRFEFGTHQKKKDARREAEKTLVLLARTYAGDPTLWNRQRLLEAAKRLG